MAYYPLQEKCESWAYEQIAARTDINFGYVTNKWITAKSLFRSSLCHHITWCVLIPASNSRIRFVFFCLRLRWTLLSFTTTSHTQNIFRLASSKFIIYYLFDICMTMVNLDNLRLFMLLDTEFDWFLKIIINQW